MLGEASVLPMGEAGGVRLVMAQIVSPNYFSKLGINAIAGRVSERIGCHSVVEHSGRSQLSVLGIAIWQEERHFRAHDTA